MFLRFAQPASSLFVPIEYETIEAFDQRMDSGSALHFTLALGGTQMVTEMEKVFYI